MARAKRGPKARRRRNRILHLAEGYRGGRHALWKSAAETVRHALSHATAARKARKGDFRRLFIQRINAAARSFGLRYSTLIPALHKAGITLDRKILADLALDTTAFSALLQKAQVL